MQVFGHPILGVYVGDVIKQYGRYKKTIGQVSSPKIGPVVWLHKIQFP